MFQSLRHSQLVIRIGLAIVFVWYGIDKLIQPQYWLDSWVPAAVQAFGGRVGIGPADLMYFAGIFEVLVALSLATGYFMRYFATAAAVFLVGVLGMNGFNDMVLIPDVGLIGALGALIIWPERTYS